MMHIKNLIATAPIPGSDNWHTAILTIDPETADELLKGNHGNRRLSLGTVARYAATMRKGDWKTSPEPLIFAPSGRLMNGQTRLHAIKATGVPQKFMCVFGVAEGVFSVLDRGRPRSYAEANGLESKSASVATLLAETAFSKGRTGTVDSEKNRVMAVIDDAYKALRDTCNSNRNVFSTIPWRAGAVARIISGEDMHYVLSTYRGLVLGNYEVLSPIARAALSASANSASWKATSGHTARILASARAWHVFEPRNALKTSVRIVNPQNHIEEMGEAVRAALKDAENV
jgi:hypothetical protein